MRDEDDCLAVVTQSAYDGVGEERFADVCIDCMRVNIKQNRGLGGYLPAESGSSKITMSALKYSARAMFTRCFWPPLRFIPFSPIWGGGIVRNSM